MAPTAKMIAARVAPKAAVPRREPSQTVDDANSDASTVRASQASQLIDIADSARFFHSSDDKPYATIPVNGHRENWPVRSAAFRYWLAQKYYESERIAPRAQSLREALNVLIGRAIYEGEQQEVFTRVGQAGGRLYLDIADKHWRAIEIAASGWSVVNEPPVRFRRARAMAALPEPICGGNIGELWDFVNVRSQDRPPP